MKKQPRLVKLKTDFSCEIGDKPLQEYPRPQYQRESYVNLNGWWQYAITESKDVPESFDGKILVPFSPESQLSGVERQLLPHQFLHYQTTFYLPKDFNQGKVFLHFGAVDSLCWVYVNGVEVGRHVGGYNAFFFDVTQSLCEKNVLHVVVQDLSDSSFFSNGKQSLKRGGMWYSPQSGIWQTVWLESVPSHYLKSVKMIPDVNDETITFFFDKEQDERVEIVVFDGKDEIVRTQTQEQKVSIKIENAKLWSPESPFLYDVQFVLGQDKVKSYFAMRTFDVQTVDGKRRIMLNNKPYFHNGLLDQGYWSDGLYTAPSDKALEYDVFLAKELGFNMLRKHIKVEPMRWYWHCDRLGMIVWQDMPSGGTYQNLWITLWLPFAIKLQKLSDKNPARFSRKDKRAQELFKEELKEMMDQLYNCPCIAVWVPFNEGWGQFDSANVAKWMKQYDKTRLVDHASGWHDQKAGDFLSLHIYYRKVKIPKKDKKGRAIVLSEFGGYSYKDMEHSFNLDEIYGYGGKEIVNAKIFTDALENLYLEQVLPCIEKGLCATVYTQLSDVEDETNGIVTYDRKVVKVEKERMQEINKRMKI
ncbi:MAG: glycoside hydrolase family 2 [Clostridia bacterium]|nr:glycoside hydrolase family 2 [Clostridia bacterium]